jgi:hypothetical protein
MMKDEFDHFEETLAEITPIIWSKRLGQDSTWQKSLGSGTTTPRYQIKFHC